MNAEGGRLSGRLDQLRPPGEVALPSLVQLDRTIQRILDRFEPAPASDKDAERQLRLMLQRIGDDVWRGVKLSFVTAVARIAFAADWRDRDEYARVRAFLIDEIAASTRTGFLNAMTRIYVETLEPGAAHSRALGRALASVQARIGAAWATVLGHFPNLFDPDAAPALVAARMEGMDDPWNGLRALGLRQPHAPGLMAAAHLAFVDRVAPRLSQRREIDRLLAWLRPPGQPRARETGAGVAVSALIRPWAERSPPPEVQALLIDRLTENYGHPRVGRSPVWNQVDPALERIFLRWLMGADIRFLFRVLTEVERGHMWAEREQFWWTRLERGLIDEVWVAFNGAGHAAAMRKLPAEGRQSGRRFGLQVGDTDKSLLIMRIGNRIVVEGTYNFMVHAFPAADPRAPKLYSQKYDVSDIRRNRSVEWTKAHLGDWQGDVERRLIR